MKKLVIVSVNSFTYKAINTKPLDKLEKRDLQMEILELKSKINLKELNK